MIIKCVCGKWHDLSPTAMAIVIAAFQEGDLHTVKRHDGVEIQTRCITEAFTDARIREFKERYKGNRISWTSLQIPVQRHPPPIERLDVDLSRARVLPEDWGT